MPCLPKSKVVCCVLWPVIPSLGLTHSCTALILTWCNSPEIRAADAVTEPGDAQQTHLTHSSVLEQMKCWRSQTISARGITQMIAKNPGRSSERFSWGIEDIVCLRCPYYSFASLCHVSYKYLCNSSSFDVQDYRLQSEEGSSFCHRNLGRIRPCQRARPASPSWTTHHCWTLQNASSPGIHFL